MRAESSLAVRDRDDFAGPRAPVTERDRLYYRTDGPYEGSEPGFYDLDSLSWCRPWADRVRESWQAIRDEYEKNVRRGQDHVVEVFNPTGPKVPRWRSVNFQTYLWRFHRARGAFPFTVGLLDSISDLTSAYINVLEAGAAIPAHCGDSNAVVRFHLGLDVPSGDCAVRVERETRRSSNGTLLAFCDAHEHASWNATGEARVSLVFDVMRPEYRARRRWICANVLAALGVVWLEARLGLLRRVPTSELLKSGKTIPLPQVLRTALRRVMGLGVYLWLPIQRRRR